MNRRFSAVVWALLLAAGGLVGGCSDSPERQAGKNLREQVAEAERHLASALDLLGSPAYKGPGGRILPAPGVALGEASDLVGLPPGTLNPAALKHLEDAIAALGQAIQANPEANAPDMALALAQVGRLHEVRAYYFAWEAAAKRGQIGDVLADGEREISVLQGLAASLKYVNTLLETAPGDAKALADAAGKQASEKAAKLKELDGEIVALQGQAKKLQEDSQKLAKEAGNLRLESKSATGKQALDLSDQGVEKQDQANKLASDLIGVENSLRNRQTDRDVLSTELDLAKSLAAVGESAGQSRADFSAKMLERKNQLASAVAGAMKKLEELTVRTPAASASQPARACAADLAKECRQIEEKAGAEYEQAAKSLEAARRALGTESPATIDAASDRATVCIAQAKLGQASLRLRAKLDAFADRLTGLWPLLGQGGEMPAAYAKLGADYLADPKAAQKAAVVLCEDAVDSCRKYVIQQTPPELRWSPQALLGASYLCLYEIGKDPANLKEAVASLDEAVKDKENSPYLADAMELDRMAHKLQAGPEEPAPAPSPAPSSAPVAAPAPAPATTPASTPAQAD